MEAKMILSVELCYL